MSHQQNDLPLDALLAGAITAVKQAGLIVTEAVTKRRTGCLQLAADTKSCNADFVTEYDKRCDTLLMALLKDVSKAAGFNPSDVGDDGDIGFLTEETLPDAEVQDKLTWVVDPIDGTTSFMHGSFDCCISVGLARNKVPLLGVIFAPLLNELFTAIRGRGAFYNGEAIPAGAKNRPRVTRLSDAMVGYHLPAQRTPTRIDTSLAIVKDLLVGEGVHSVRCYGSAALDMCGVAIGRLDAYTELGISAWDVCAGKVIVEESGCFASFDAAGEGSDGDASERATTVRTGKMGVTCASTPELGRALQQLVKKHGLTPEKYLK